MKKLIFILLGLLLIQTSKAQTLKKLGNKINDKVNSTVNNKANSKIDKTVNQAADKVENTVNKSSTKHYSKSEKQLSANTTENVSASAQENVVVDGAGEKKQQGAISSPSNLVIDSKDNVFFLHQNGLGKITPDGKYINLVNVSGNERKTPYFSAGQSLIIDSKDNLYISGSNTITKYTVSDNNIIVASDYLTKFYKYRQKDGRLNEAMFSDIKAMAIDKDDNIYILEPYSRSQRIDTSNIHFLTNNYFLNPKNNNSKLWVVRKISSKGVVSTLTKPDGKYIVVNPRKNIWHMIVSNDGNLVFSTGTSRSIEKIDLTTGKQAVMAGKPDKRNTCPVYIPGDTSKAELFEPFYLATNKQGDIFYSDMRIHRIIKIANGKVSTVAGNNKIQPCAVNIGGRAEEGYKDGKALTALFAMTKGIAFDSKGNMFIADEWNNCIRKLNPEGVVSTVTTVFKKY